MILLLPAIAAAAGEPSGRSLGGDLRRGVADLAHFATAPSRWGAEDWGRLALAGGVVAAVVFADQDIRTESQDSRSSSSNHLANLVDGGGNPLGWGGVVIATTYLGGWATGNERARELGFQMAEAAVLTSTVVAGLKVATGRSRPDEEDGSTSARPLRGGITGGHSSFPSQHTAFAFSLAAVAADGVGPGFGWFAYPAAALVGWSRIHDDAHWASDVLAGALVGTATGLWVARRASDADRMGGLQALPWSTGSAWGLQVFGLF